MGKQVRVLQVHNRYRSSLPSGENRVVDNEAAALRRHGHHVDRFERLNDEMDNWALTRRLLVAGTSVWNLGTYWRLRHALQARRPDVVHVHNTMPLLSPSVLKACYRERVPVVVTLHNYGLACARGDLFRDGGVCHDCLGHIPAPSVGHGCYHGSRLATLPIATSMVVNRSAWRNLVSAYICISSAQREILGPLGLPRSRVFVKMNMARDALITFPAERENKKDTVVYLGRITAAKGLPMLMQAWAMYAGPAGSEGLRLVIAGAGPLEDEVLAWARERNDVDFLGPQSPKACELLLRSARAAVVPSAWEEPFGLVVIEAMEAGVPVIAPAHAAFPELVIDGKEGVLFPPGEVTALARALHDVATSPERFEQYGRNARKAYESRFHPDAIVCQLVSVYKFAIEHPVWEPIGSGSIHMEQLSKQPFKLPEDGFGTHGRSRTSLALAEACDERLT
jgi:glycosyltransferase involved in cell wall biosynthesis